MENAKYNGAADFYTNFVEKSLSIPTSVISVVTNETLKILGDVSGLKICDVACGQGHVSRNLVKLGAHVTGVDISEELLELARAKKPEINYIHGDAQSLKALKDDSFDAVVCNLSFMDFPSHKDVFQSIKRILRPNGNFVFSVLHPCFESPFNSENPAIELDESGDFLACRVHSYLNEGHWQSGGDGVRGRVGAYHRTLSTYINDLLGAGFELLSIHEPSLLTSTSKDGYTKLEEQWFSKIPRGLIVKSQKAVRS